MEEKHKKRMLEAHGYSSEDRSFKRWKEIQDWKKVLRNYVIMTLCKVLPDNEFKNMIYRKSGARIGRNVSIFGSNLDIFFPELIEIGDDSIIGMLTSLITHEFLTDGWRKGPIKIGRNVTIGAMTLILPGVKIGDGATVAAYSLVNRDVEPGTLVGGVPIKRIR